MKDKIISIIKELIPYIIIVIVVFGIKTYIATPVLVDGSSMSPTLSDNQFIILSRSTKKIDRNDIVVFDYEDSKLIKRVIGLPGESIKYENGILYINDREYEDKFSSITEDFELSEFGIKKIPENSYFLLGDNRNNSIDSRVIGPVNISNINGETIFSVYPFNTFGKIEK